MLASARTPLSDLLEYCDHVEGMNTTPHSTAVPAQHNSVQHKTAVHVVTCQVIHTSKDTNQTRSTV